MILQSAENYLVREQQRLRALSEMVARVPRLRATGTVIELVGLTVIAQGPAARVGELCFIYPKGTRAAIRAQVVGFRRGHTLLLPLGPTGGLEAGCKVLATGGPLSVRVGPGMLGRIVDAFGRPLDHARPLGETELRPVENTPPPPLERARITKKLGLGIRAIDSLLMCGLGQRVGIFAGAGLGKSTLLGMMARFHQADVAVIALIGERGCEVRDFLETHLDAAGLARSVVVVATSDEPALVRITAGLTAATIAEYFRDNGCHVLLLMDSLTRLARAQREVGLSIGETPTSRGYPPSLYEFLARLLERAGATAKGSITGIYAVLVEGDDMSEPVSDAVSAIMDGQIRLSRTMAEQGHYPAIDVLGSISRVMPRLATEKQRQAAGLFRELLAAYREIEDLIAIGAYRPGFRPVADRACRLWPQMREFLRQSPHEYADPEASCQRLIALMTEGR